MSDYTGGDDGYTPLMGASRTPYDVNSTPRHEVLNYEGTPTQFSDDSGLKALLTREGIFDVNSFNPIIKEGEKITADTARQATNEEGQLLFLDADGNQTTRPTGVPAIGGTVGDAAYMKKPRSGGGVFSPIISDFTDMAKDPQFHKFLLSAAAIGTGGLAANAAFGVGGLGAGLSPVATTYPISSGALLGGTELAAPALGVAGGDIGAFTAADALASVAGQGAFDSAAALGMTLDQAVNTGLISSTGALTDAGAAAMMGTYEAGSLGGLSGAGKGITASEALRYANMAKAGLGALGAGGSGGAGAFPFAVPIAAAGGAGASGLSQMVSTNPQYLTTGSAPTTTPTGLIDYKPLSYIEPAHYASVSDIKPLSMLDKSPFESGLQAAHGGHIKESMGRHPELQEVDPRLLSMIMQSMSFQDGGKSHVPEFITGATGHYVKGKGDGQSDEIPAMLADGEFVWDADTVAQLGNGSSDAGANFLDKFREAVRAHKRSAPNDKIPPKASPLQYVKEAMKNTEKE